MINHLNINFENSFLYLFSAIPQVIGALAGLLGVFLLFKFQSLNKSIIGFGEQILLHLNNEPFLVEIKDRELRLLKSHLNDGIMRNDQETVVSQIAGLNYRLDQIEKDVHFIHHENLEIKSERNGLIQTFKICENIQWTCLEYKYNLTQDSKRLLANCIGVILISLLCLPFVPLLHSSGNLIVLGLISILVLIWFGMCLIKIVWTVIVSISHDYNDELMPNKKGFFSELFKIFKQRKRAVYKRQWVI